jgi:hypothetical protein
MGLRFKMQAISVTLVIVGLVQLLPEFSRAQGGKILRNMNSN